MSATVPLILASTSVTRRQLLERLGLQFEIHAPQVDEAARPKEAPAALAERLAQAKAQAVAVHLPGCHVIGSDQVAVVNGQLLGKPGDRERAACQLALAAGRLMRFETAVCVVDGRSGEARVRRVPFEVQMRALSGQEIERYLEREQPFDCAGALRSEGLGVTLCQRMSGDDPTALLGLPLIALCELLRECGVSLP